MEDNTVTCSSCGWVSFPVSRDYIKKWEDKWAEYWPTLDEEGRDAFGLPNGPPKAEDTYYNCSFCDGSYKNFKDSLPDDCPDGCTIGPILTRHE